MKTETETTATAEEQGVATVTLTPTLPDYYGNIVKAHVTPFELNLAVGRAVIPFESPEDKEVQLRDHVLPVVRVGLPLVSLPSLIRLLQLQLKHARGKGYLPEEPAKPEASQEEKS